MATDRFMQKLVALIDALEQAHHAGDDAEFDRVTRQIRELIGRGFLYG